MRVFRCAGLSAATEPKSPVDAITIEDTWAIHDSERTGTYVNGKPIIRSNLDSRSFAVLAAFLVTLWAVTCWILRRQDTL